MGDCGASDIKVESQWVLRLNQGHTNGQVVTHTKYDALGRTWCVPVLALM